MFDELLIFDLHSAVTVKLRLWFTAQVAERRHVRADPSSGHVGRQFWGQMRRAEAPPTCWGAVTPALCPAASLFRAEAVSFIKHLLRYYKGYFHLLLLGVAVSEAKSWLDDEMKCSHLLSLKVVPDWQGCRWDAITPGGGLERTVWGKTSIYVLPLKRKVRGWSGWSSGWCWHIEKHWKLLRAKKTNVTRNVCCTVQEVSSYSRIVECWTLTPMTAVLASAHPHC